jgi:hypothetical protein
LICQGKNHELFLGCVSFEFFLFFCWLHGGKRVWFVEVFEGCGSNWPLYCLLTRFLNYWRILNYWAVSQTKFELSKIRAVKNSSCQKFVLSKIRAVKNLSCQKFKLSKIWAVKNLSCQKFELSKIRAVKNSSCQKF